MIYGAAITDPISAATFVALTEYWIHTGGPKREPGRYHTPSAFFAPGTRLSTLVQAVESAHPPLVLTAELCGLYNSPIVSYKFMWYSTTNKMHAELKMLCRNNKTVFEFWLLVLYID